MWTTKEEETFFNLLDKVVNDPTRPWKERADAVRRAARRAEAETELEEFAGWFQDE